MKIFKQFQYNSIDELPFFLMLPAFVWELLFFCIPLVSMLLMSFVTQWDVSIFSGFTLEHYITFFQAEYIHIIIRSLLLALWTALLCFFIGYPLAYYIALKAHRTVKNILLFLLILPFWTNFLILIYAWFFVLEKYGLINTVLLRLGIIQEPLTLLYNLSAVSLVMCYCYLPFMVVPIYVALERLDWTLIEASQDLGANMRQTFMYVIFPLSLPGVLTGFLLVFVPAFGEFAIPLFIGGDKYMLLGTLIEYYFLNVRNSSLGAAITCISCIVLAAVTLLTRILIFKKEPTILEDEAWHG